jgi:hypothetical protein
VPYKWRSKTYQQLSAKNFEAIKVWFTVPDSTPPQVDRDFDDPQPELGPNQYGIIRVYTDGQLWTTRELRKSGELLRIYSGIKVEQWQFEIEGRVNVSNLQSLRPLGADWYEICPLNESRLKLVYVVGWRTPPSGPHQPIISPACCRATANGVAPVCPLHAGRCRRHSLASGTVVPRATDLPSAIEAINKIIDINCCNTATIRWLEKWRTTQCQDHQPDDGSQMEC